MPSANGPPPSLQPDGQPVLREPAGDGHRRHPRQRVATRVRATEEEPLPHVVRRLKGRGERVVARRGIGRGGRHQHVNLPERLLKLAAEQHPRLHRPVLHLGRHQRRRLQPRARCPVQLLRRAAHQAIASAGSLRIGDAHEYRSGDFRQRQRYVHYLRAQAGQRFQRGVNGPAHVGVHIRRVAQLNHPAHAHTANISVQHPVVVRHRPAAGGRVQRVVAGDCPQHQGAVLDRLGHGRSGVHKPAHRRNPVPADASERWP